MRYLSFATIVASLLLLTGCTPNISPSTYSVGSVGQVNRVVKGTVISARPVNISGTNTGVGSTAGAAAGGVAGSQIGSSAEANIIGAIGGAVIGGIAGAAVEENASKQQGMEYVVETTNGALLTVVQGGEAPLQAGQKVLVIYGERSRVIPDSSSR